MKKRLLASVLAGVLALGVLTGCGSSSKDDKVIKSYYVKMILKNNITYEFICFKKPNKFFKEVNK